MWFPAILRSIQRMLSTELWCFLYECIDSNQTKELCDSLASFCLFNSIRFHQDISLNSNSTAENIHLIMSQAKKIVFFTNSKSKWRCRRALFFNRIMHIDNHIFLDLNLIFISFHIFMFYFYLAVSQSGLLYRTEAQTTSERAIFFPILYLILFIHFMCVFHKNSIQTSLFLIFIASFSSGLGLFDFSICMTFVERMNESRKK